MIAAPPIRNWTLLFAMSASKTSLDHAESQLVPEHPGAPHHGLPARLPWSTAAVVIGGLSLGFWIGIWKLCALIWG